MTKINGTIAYVGGTWRGLEQALAMRDRFRKFLNKGHPDGVTLPHVSAGQGSNQGAHDKTITEVDGG